MPRLPDQDPGTVTLHRLNRVEYDNTVRDLLHTTQRPAQDFPVDDRGYGFDNIADVLSVSPFHVEMYQRAAESLVGEALGGSGVDEAVQQLEAEDIGSSVGTASGGAWNLYSNGEVAASVELPGAGDYTISVRAWQSAGGPDPARMTLTAAGMDLGTFDVTALSGAPEVYEANVTLPGGLAVVSVAFINDFYDSVAGEDRNLYVDWIRIQGPLGATSAPPAARAEIMTCDPATTGRDACADQILRAFARRAWRRPPTDDEITRLRTFLDVAESHGDGFDEGIALALQAILVSPHFIYRVELDADPSSTTPHLLNDFELATRLSYFLWSSMPDDELSALADAGTLHEPATLRAQAERMLADDKAKALTDNFAGQWLYSRAIENVDPDYMLFPEYDPELGQSMRTEMELFFREFLDNDLPVRQLLTADFTFVDYRLASHYDLAPVDSGSGFVRTTLPPERAAGILSKASFLTVTSYPRRTSPVKRGVWVLEQLLCSKPPPPPPGVEGLEEQMIEGGTLRDRLAAHRTDPVCNSCHSVMDPIGLGLESFDAIGQFRTTMEGETIDTSGELPDQDGFHGETFNGAVELGQIISNNDQFPRCVAEHMTTYALGRGLGRTDEAWLDTITEDYLADGGHLRALILAIVTSDPFRMRRGGEL